MFTKTYTDEAVAIARRISNAQKKELEHLKADELNAIVEEFSAAIGDDGPELDLDVALTSTKANTAAIARQVAEMVLKTHGVEAAAIYRRTQRNSFYAEMVNRRDALFAKTVKLAQDELTKVGWTTWESRVNEYLNLRADAEMTAELVSMIEALCEKLSLGDAAEHALSLLQDEILRNAGYGTSRSTSAVHNASEDAKQRARSDLLRSAGFNGLKPVIHIV